MKKNFLSRALASAIAAICALGTSVVSQTVIAEDGVKYEFEDGVLNNAVVPEEGSERWMEGASGGKFVFLENAGESATVSVMAENTGMYEIIICYSAPYTEKIQNLLINGVDQGQISMSSKDWTEMKVCTAKLNAGENEISIKANWGWANIDYVRVKPAVLPDITNYDRTLCDAKATDLAQRVMAYLADNYGNHIISGQQEIYKYGPHDFEYEFNYIKENTGKLPAIRGFDYLNCNPLYGTEDGTAATNVKFVDDGTTDRIIDWVNTKKGIATSSWHITVPKNFTNYKIGDRVEWADYTYGVWADDDNGTHTKPATDFDTKKVLTEGTKENEYYMLCLKLLATELKKLQDADVPLIFRPLHEAEGGGGETGSWFWWGKDGSTVYKDLWKLTYKTLTETYGLHNIIWEWNSYAYESSADWYPGDEYVDLIAYDKYNCTLYLEENNWQPSLVHNDSAISGTFYNIVEKYNGKKMVAMAENDSIPTLKNLLDEKAAWLYFCPWYDGGSPNTNFLSNPIFNRVEDLAEIYQSDYCITLDELPDLKTYESGTIPDPKPTEPPSPTESKVTTPPPTSETSPNTTVITTETPDKPVSSGKTTTVTDPDKPVITTPNNPSEEIKVPEGVKANKYGDTNDNGLVNVSDLVALNTFLLNPKNYPLTDIQIANSDCIKDEIIDNSDASLLLNFLAEQIGESDLGLAPAK